MINEILISIIVIWFASGLIAAVLDYIYESQKKGAVLFNVNIICDMGLCLLLGIFSLVAVIVWERSNSLIYK